VLHRALDVALEHPNLTVAAAVIEALAGAALADGDPERAAYLLGGAVAVRGTTAVCYPDVTGVATAAEALIGAHAVAAAHAAGSALSRAEALTAAR